MPLGPSICVIRVIPPIFLFHSIPIAGLSGTELRRNRVDFLSRLDLNGGQMELAGDVQYDDKQGTWQPDGDSSNAADRKKTSWVAGKYSVFHSAIWHLHASGCHRPRSAVPYVSVCIKWITKQNPDYLYEDIPVKLGVPGKTHHSIRFRGSVPAGLQKAGTAVRENRQAVKYRQVSSEDVFPVLPVVSPGFFFHRPPE